nr:methyltransferase [Bacteroidota bacterium]
MIEILHTEDGSTTLFVKDLDEAYHSKFGAITESEHVFIQTGFHYLSGHCQQLNIFEVGFGTGLNALLTYYAAKNTRVNYFTLETHPISLEIVSQLNYPTLIAQKDSDQIFRSLHSCDWDTPVRISK